MWWFKPLCDVPCSDLIGGVIWRLVTDTSCALGLLNMNLYDWMHLNGSNTSLLSQPLSLSLSAAVIGYQSFVVEAIVVAIKEARWKQVSILTFVHLSRPLSLCLPHSLWFHISPFAWTMNRATCSQKPEFSELVISWTAGITWQHLTLVMKTRGASVSVLFKLRLEFFPAHLWTPDSECETPVSQFGIASRAEINQSPIFHPTLQTL